MDNVVSPDFKPYYEVGAVIVAINVGDKFFMKKKFSTHINGTEYITPQDQQNIRNLLIVALKEWCPDVEQKIHLYENRGYHNDHVSVKIEKKSS